MRKVKDHLFDLAIAGLLVVGALLYYYGHELIYRLELNGAASLIQYAGR